MQANTFQLSFPLANLTNLMPFRCGPTKQTALCCHNSVLLLLSAPLALQSYLPCTVIRLAYCMRLCWSVCFFWVQWVEVVLGCHRGSSMRRLGEEAKGRRGVGGGDGRNRGGCLIVIICTALASGPVQSWLKGFATGIWGGGKVHVFFSTWGWCHSPDPPSTVVQSQTGVPCSPWAPSVGSTAPPWQRRWICAGIHRQALTFWSSAWHGPD